MPLPTEVLITLHAVYISIVHGMAGISRTTAYCSMYADATRNFIFVISIVTCYDTMIITCYSNEDFMRLRKDVHIKINTLNNTSC